MFGYSEDRFPLAMETFRPAMIDQIGDFVQRHLVVLLAVFLIPLKIALMRLCRDPEGEASAILSIPEDLCYVALGLILSDLLIPAGALHHYFSSSKHVSIDLAIVIAINVAVALTVHRMSQSAQRAYRLWRGSDVVAREGEPVQGELVFAPVDEDSAMHLIVHHFSTLAMWYSFQLILVIFWLHWLAKVVANVQN